MESAFYHLNTLKVPFFLENCPRLWGFCCWEEDLGHQLCLKSLCYRWNFDSSKWLEGWKSSLLQFFDTCSLDNCRVADIIPTLKKAMQAAQSGTPGLLRILHSEKISCHRFLNSVVHWEIVQILLFYCFSVNESLQSFFDTVQPSAVWLIRCL